MSFSQYFVLTNQPDDPREINYWDGKFRAEYDYDRGELQEARYYNTNQLTEQEELAVREIYNWRLKPTGYLYEGYSKEIFFRYVAPLEQIDGPDSDGITVNKDVVFDGASQFKEVERRLERNIYALGAYIDDILENPAFFSLFSLAIEAKTQYIHAHCVPIVQFILGLEEDQNIPAEAKEFMQMVLPNSKTIKEHSLDTLVLEQCIDYWGAQQLLMQDERRV